VHVYQSEKWEVAALRFRTEVNGFMVDEVRVKFEPDGAHQMFDIDDALLCDTEYTVFVAACSSIVPNALGCSPELRQQQKTGPCVPHPPPSPPPRKYPPPSPPPPSPKPPPPPSPSPPPLLPPGWTEDGPPDVLDQSIQAIENTLESLTTTAYVELGLGLLLICAGVVYGCGSCCRGKPLPARAVTAPVPDSAVDMAGPQRSRPARVVGPVKIFRKNAEDRAPLMEDGLSSAGVLELTENANESGGGGMSGSGRGGKKRRGKSKACRGEGPDVVSPSSHDQQLAGVAAAVSTAVSTEPEPEFAQTL